MGPHGRTTMSPGLRIWGLKIRMLSILDRFVSQGDIQVWSRRLVTALRVIKGCEPICRDNSFDSLIDSYVTGPLILYGVGPTVILRINNSGLSRKVLAGA